MIGDAQHTTLRLIQSLEDQLDQFPLGSVIRSHAELVEHSQEALSERLNMLNNPGRRYWDHPAELLHEQAGVLFGAMFVLVQAAVTETVSILMRIHQLNGQTLTKRVALQLEAPVDTGTGLSYPEIANAAANYYKHRFEWPKLWDEATDRQQILTIAMLRTIGMSDDSDLADNLERASRKIMRTSNETTLSRLSTLVIEDWREALSARLRKDFQLTQY